MRKTHLFTVLLTLTLQVAFAQLTQQVRGTVTDQLLQSPLAGATVTIQGTPFVSIADGSGQFIFEQVPVGTYSLQATFVGYKNGSLNNVVVISGKELVVNISMEPSMESESEVLVKAKYKKNQPINNRSLVSARAFTVEETQKYAASINDPLRMATNFAGVVGADDGNNNIVIRGNAPSGLLWRMEGIDIPNPNHFSSANSSGGGISILSAALLSNSDFITGAWASEYGNALSGAFDMNLRKGNNKKREFSLQAGLLGLNAAAEGPIKLGKNKGSYLVNYRYSTLSLLGNLGLDIGMGSTDFQDLSYNIHLPTTKAGSFTLFGFTGISAQKADHMEDSTKWDGEFDRYGFTYTGKTIFNGATHQLKIGNNALWKSALGFSYLKTGFNETYLDDQLVDNLNFRANDVQKKWTLTSSINYRINNSHSIRSGFIVNHIDYNLFEQSKENLGAPLKKVLEIGGTTQTVQAYSEWQGKPHATITFNAGLHFLTLLHNNSTSIEPRAALKWDATATGTFTLGYGLHGQMQGLGVYFAQATNGAGETFMPNKDIDFTRAHHFVTGFNQQLGQHYRLNTELYYQHLFDVPVGSEAGSIVSSINLRDGYLTDALVNKGKGRNYGVELTLERNLKNNFYLMWSNSVYQSKYTALDGIERNTRWNGNYATTLVTGKDFVYENGKRIFGINLKTVFAGGFRQTPIDLAASQIAGYAVFNNLKAFEDRLPGYFRTDLRFSLTWNRTQRTNTLSLDIQNASNRQNIFGNYFDPRKQSVVTSYQVGIIPVLNYKVEF